MEKWRAWEWLLALLLPVAGGVLTFVGNKFFEARSKNVDEATRIREELRGQVEVLKKVFEEFHALRAQYADLDIACSRCLSRLEDCVEFISMLLEAEQCLSEHNTKRAKTLLLLVERDKQMRQDLEAAVKRRAQERQDLLSSRG